MKKIIFCLLLALCCVKGYGAGVSITEVAFLCAPDREYACPNEYILINFNTETTASTRWTLQCKNETASTWRTIGTTYNVGSGGFILSYAQLKNSGVNLFSKFHFRARTGTSNSSTTSSLYYLPQFKFPDEAELEVIPAECYGENTVIKVPYEGETNYTLTIKGPNTNSWGGNLETTSSTVTKVNGYYIFSNNFVEGKYILTVENKIAECPQCGCAFIDSFFVSSPPLPFTLTYIPTLIGGYNIPTIGNTGQVKFKVSGSKAREITLHAGSRSNTLNLSAYSPDSGWHGEATINLPAGTYNNIYVTDEDYACCVNYSQSILLTQPTPITFDTATTQPSCNTANLVNGNAANTANGTITLSNIEGGIGNYKYSTDGGTIYNNLPSGWNSITTSGNNFPAGNYTVIVADEHGNATTIPVTIAPPTPISVTLSAETAPTLWCSDDGKVTVSASGGTGTLWYSKDDDNYSSTSNIVSGYSPGVDTVYVQDDKGCTVKQSVSIPTRDILTVVSKDTVAPTCNGGNDGSCMLVMGNTQGSLSVSGLPLSCNTAVNGSTITINDLESGNYTCSVTDTKNGKSCSIAVSFTIPQKDSIRIDSTAVTFVSGKGSATGGIAVSVSGGNAGNYTVSLYEKDVPTLLQSQPNVSNHTFTGLRGAPDGKTYTVKAADVQGCENTRDVRVFEPQDTLRLAASITQFVSCNGRSDAAVTLAAAGGWGNYQYSKDNFAWSTSPVFTGFSAGNYTFYVKDKFGGTHTASIAIDEPMPLTIVRDSLFSVLCQGESTGLLRYRISGGTYPYTLPSTTGAVSHSIANGDTLITVSGLPAANYTFTVTDSRGCNAVSVPETIDEPAQLQLPAPTITHTSCELNNGVLSAQAVGGVAPYTYTLSKNGDNIQTQKLGALSTVDFINLSAGQYRIAVADSNDCFVASSLLTINGYANPSVDSVIVRPAACFGENNGRVEITHLHASTTPVRTFKIYNTDESYTETNTTGIFEHLLADDYFVTLYDSMSCSSNTPYPVTVREPQPLLLAVDTIYPSAVKSARGGKIFFKIHGGNIGSKTVRLRNANGDAVDSLSGVNDFQFNFAVYVGEYRLEVSDFKGCRFTTTLLQVSEPAESLHLLITEVKDALCKSQTGSIVVQGAGGWGGYRYKRAGENDYADLNRFENLYPGSCVITVKDRMGAAFSAPIIIHEPQDSLRAQVLNYLPPSCGNNGKLFIQLSGGTPPYKLYHGNDTTFAAQPQVVERQGLASGAILLHLTDANGCRFELEAALPDTALLNIEHLEVKYPEFAGAANGAISVLVRGGVAPYIYQWSVLGVNEQIFPNNTPAFSHLSAGYYHVQITDAAGCTADAQTYLANPADQLFSVVKIGHETSFAAANGYAVLHADSVLTDYEIITPELTALAYTATDSNTYFFTQNDTVFLQNLASGNWFISGKTLAGQRVVARFEIKPCPAFSFANTRLRPIARRGASNGEIRVEVQGGGGDNRFSWTDTTGQIFVSVDNQQVSTLSNIPAGRYTVQVEDRYGNRLSQTLAVPEPAQDLHISIARQKNQSCRTYRDAYVVLSASGGWGDYQFRHESATFYNNGSSYSNLTTGEQYFYLLDQLGSIDSVQVTITEPEYLRSAVVRVDSVLCKDGTDGRIVFDIRGGTAPYSFVDTAVGLWFAGNEAVNLHSGFYTCVFTDSNSCAGQDTLRVYVPEPDSLLFKNIAVTHTTCNEDNGKINTELQGGTRPYRYRWLDFNGNEIGNDSTISDLKRSGVYRLEVNDINGCTQSMPQHIRPSTLPFVAEITTTDVLCYGDTTGTARVAGITFAEPFAPYLLTWSNSDTGEYSNRFSLGQHYVTIADTNHCTTTHYFDIGQPDSLRLRFAAVKNPHCFGYSDGYVHAETLGGYGNYTYWWSTGDTTPHIDSLIKGTYHVRVTDGNGCWYEKQTTLNEPDFQHIDLGEDVLMCPGNAITLDGQDYPAHRWFTFDGDISDERYLTVRDADNYFLEATDVRGCSVWGERSIAIGNNVLESDFLLSSDAAQGDTLILIELSNRPIDSLQWQYDSDIFTPLNVQNGYLLELLCKQTGMYNIGLYAYSGGCTSYAVKQVEIAAARDSGKVNSALGYRDPLIRNFIAYPNPSNGIFTVKIELREKSNITLTLFSVASGMRLSDLSDYDADTYIENFNLSNLNSGVYVLLLTAGKERRQIKVMISE